MEKQVKKQQEISNILELRRWYGSLRKKEKMHYKRTCLIELGCSSSSFQMWLSPMNPFDINPMVERELCRIANQMKP